MLLKIAGIKENEITIINEDVFSDDVMNRFKNNEIDALYITTPHPRIDLYNLYLMKPFDIIGTEQLINLNKQSMKELVHFKEYKINVEDYNIKRLDKKILIDSISVPCCLITSNKIENEYIYKLIKTIFKYQLFTKITRTEKYRNNKKDTKKQMLSEYSKTKDGKIIKQIIVIIMIKY